MFCWQRPRRQIRLILCILSVGAGAGATAEDMRMQVIPDESPGPTLRQPLPKLAMPDKPTSDLRVFSTEVPPPPAMEPVADAPRAFSLKGQHD